MNPTRVLVEIDKHDKTNYFNGLDPYLFKDDYILEELKTSVGGKEVSVPIRFLDPKQHDETSKVDFGGVVTYSPPVNYPTLSNRVLYENERPKNTNERIDLAVLSYEKTMALRRFMNCARKGMELALDNMNLLKVLNEKLTEKVPEDVWSRTYIFVRGTTIDNPLYGGTRIPVPDDVKYYNHPIKRWVDADLMIIGDNIEDHLLECCRDINSIDLFRTFRRPDDFVRTLYSKTGAERPLERVICTRSTRPRIDEKSKRGEWKAVKRNYRMNWNGHEVDAVIFSTEEAAGLIEKGLKFEKDNNLADARLENARRTWPLNKTQEQAEDFLRKISGESLLFPYSV